MQHWHPMIVHLPLALWSCSALLYSGARLLRRAPLSGHLAAAATVNLVLGSVAAVCAIATGLVAASGLEVVGIAQDSLTRHIGWASLATLLFLGLTLLLAIGRSWADPPGPGLLVVLWCATACLLLTGYYGGRNVYRYGLGVDLATAHERATHPPSAVRRPPPPLP